MELHLETFSAQKPRAGFEPANTPSAAEDVTRFCHLGLRPRQDLNLKSDGSKPPALIHLATRAILSGWVLTDLNRHHLLWRQVGYNYPKNPSAQVGKHLTLVRPGGVIAVLEYSYQLPSRLHRSAWSLTTVPPGLHRRGRF